MSNYLFYFFKFSWTGGKYGIGKRMSLKNTRAIIDAIHEGAVD
jgi:phosphoenolpyruvate carboxykinase (ATP)